MYVYNIYVYNITCNKYQKTLINQLHFRQSN